jgi:simple sugar transport system ATP-binding protein
VQGLRVRGRSGQEAVRDVSLQVHAGEVLGLAGVEGNGQLECLEALAGLRLPLAGTLEVGGAPIARLTNREVRRAGVAYVPEDRLAAGLAADASIVDNLLANRLGSGGFAHRGVLRRGAMRKEARDLVTRFGVRCGSIDQAAGGLSGGNMQKVILAREISVAPKVLLVAEPTRGLDVAAIALVHEQLAQAAEAGTGVVVLSSDIDELLSICTRILVFREGRVVADFGDVESLTPQQMGAAMLGVDGERLAQVPA